jgi:hypothetical protein
VLALKGTADIRDQNWGEPSTLSCPGAKHLIHAPTLRRSEVRPNAGRIQVPDLMGRALSEV